MPEGDLYSIGIEPEPGAGTGEYSVPNPSRPTGSIGGSDVGANEQDDQRIRDLMQMYLNDSTVIDMLSNLLIINNGGVPKLLGGWHDTNGVDVLVDQSDPGSTTYTDPMGNAKSITLLGNPIMVQWKTEWYIFFTDDGNDPNWRMTAYMMLDGQFIGYSSITMDDEKDAAAARGHTRRFTAMGQCALKPGVAINNLGTSAAIATTILAAGAHTFRLDHELSVDGVSAGTLDFAIGDEMVMVYDLGEDDLVTIT